MKAQGMRASRPSRWAGSVDRASLSIPVSRWIRALLGLVVLSICAVTASASVLSIDPPLTYIDYPEQFTLALRVDGTSELRGFETTLVFDSTFVDLVSVHRGSLFDSYVPYGLYWAVEETATSVEVECLIIPSDECVSGTGQLLTLTFATKDVSGETALQIESPMLRDCQGLPVAIEAIHDGAIVVGPKATLFFDPDPKIVGGAGWKCVLSSCIDTVDTIHAFRVHLRYDPALVEFDSATVGSLFLTDPPIPYWFYVKEESPTLVRIECSLLGPGTFVNGPGQLTEVHFRTIAEFDTTEVIYDWWNVWNPDIVPFYPIAVDHGLIIMDAELQAVGEENGGHPRSVDTAPRLILERVGPNPAARHEFVLRQISSTGWAAENEAVAAPLLPWQASVCDVTGREIWRSALSTGSRLLWEGCDVKGMPVAPGVYWILVARPDAKVQSKAVVVR